MNAVTTIGGNVFTAEDHNLLAYLIWKRWGCDYNSAHVAWKRLFQNSSTLEDFTKMVKSHNETVK